MFEHTSSFTIPRDLKDVRGIGKIDPYEALAFFLANPEEIDLIITDMTMPHMAGNKMAEEIPKIRSDLLIILCTGYSDRNSKESAQKLGIRKTIEKPNEKVPVSAKYRVECCHEYVVGWHGLTY